MMNIRVFESKEKLGRRVAEEILGEYKRKGRLVLGVPWGTTPVPVFDAFSELVLKNNIDLSGLHMVMMDEYVESSGSGYSYVGAEAPYSGHYHMEKDFLSKLPEKQARQLRQNMRFPDVANPEGFDDFIAKKIGGVDLFLVAVGAEDGHVAMCGPGASIDSRTRIVKIAETVRKYNFDKMSEHFRNSINNVPRYGVSIGLATILDARKILFIAHGSSKSHIASVFYRAGKFEAKWPITFLWKAKNNCETYLDRDAAKEIKIPTTASGGVF